MKLRFQVDADLDEDIVTGLRRREPSLDFQTAMGGGLEALNDRDVLAPAASLPSPDHGRAFLTV
ncbi:MAG: hypothetical protein ACRD3V_11120 [Vicinamibacteria bacterium]